MAMSSTVATTVTSLPGYWSPLTDSVASVSTSTTVTFSSTSCSAVLPIPAALSAPDDASGEPPPAGAANASLEPDWSTTSGIRIPIRSSSSFGTVATTVPSASVCPTGSPLNSTVTPLTGSSSWVTVTSTVTPGTAVRLSETSK